MHFSTFINLQNWYNSLFCNGKFFRLNDYINHQFPHYLINLKQSINCNNLKIYLNSKEELYCQGPVDLSMASLDCGCCASPEGNFRCNLRPTEFLASSTKWSQRNSMPEIYISGKTFEEGEKFSIQSNTG